MDISRRKIVTAVMAAVATGALTVTPVTAAGDGMGAVKLEGAWIAKGVELPLQWTFVLSPDSSGRRAALHGSIDVGTGSGAAFGADYASPIIGQLVMTGSDSGKFSTMWYGIKRLPSGPLSATIVYIGVNKGEVKFVGQGEAISTHHLAYYLPSSDADGDGLPDDGATPVFGPITLTTTDTRLPLPQ